METRAERRRRMKLMRDGFVPRYKFLEECGCAYYGYTCLGCG